MKFNLSKVRSMPKDDEEKAKLLALGFTFDPDGGWIDFYPDVDPSIELNTLEELLAFVKEWGRIVFDEGSIQIYDDYRE